MASALVRWAAVEAVVRYHRSAPVAPAFVRIQQRRGTPMARVASAMKLLALVFYGLRDGEVRCLKKKAALNKAWAQPRREQHHRRGPHKARPTN